MLKRLTSTIVLLPLLLSSIPAQANITDSISSSFSDRVFDTAIDRWGITYRDSLIFAQWNRLRSGTLPYAGTLAIYFSHNVNMRNYSFKTELISPSGISSALTGSETKSEDRYSLYCYRTTCKTTYLLYNVNFPIGTETGEYSVKLTANWRGQRCSGTVCEQNVEFTKSVEAPKAMVLIGNPAVSNSDKIEIKVPGIDAQPVIKEPPTKEESSVPNNLTKPQVKTIVCGKGNKSVKIAQYNPKCPTGWQQKIRTQCQKGDKKMYFWVFNSKCPRGYKRI